MRWGEHIVQQFNLSLPYCPQLRLYSSVNSVLSLKWPIAQLVLPAVFRAWDPGHLSFSACNAFLQGFPLLLLSALLIPEVSAVMLSAAKFDHCTLVKTTQWFLNHSKLHQSPSSSVEHHVDQLCLSSVEHHVDQLCLSQMLPHYCITFYLIKLLLSLRWSWSKIGPLLSLPTRRSFKSLLIIWGG